MEEWKNRKQIAGVENAGTITHIYDTNRSYVYRLANMTKLTKSAALTDESSSL